MSPPTQADLEFERLPQDYAAGTSKLYSRGDFLSLDDPLAFDEGDFVGRLRALFGPAEGDEYVLRHRATGLVVTAYSAQSGPSYGGGPRFEGPLPAPETLEWAPAASSEGEQRAARIAADPELAAGPPSRRPEHRRPRLDLAEIQRLRELDHRWHRRFADANAPRGLAEVVARLDALVSSVRPADWEAIRYYSDGPSVYRVGARDGESFSDELPTAESLDVLLRMAEANDSTMKDTAGSPFDDPSMRVVELWTMTMQGLLDEDEGEDDDFEDEDEDDFDDDFEGEDDDDDDFDEDRETKLHALRRALPRVQAAWFRYVDRLTEHDAELRALLVASAREQIAILELDPLEAEAALAALQ